MKVNEYRQKPQPISNQEIRLSILSLAMQNGGLKSIAEKSGINYDALWGQMNRNAGVLAYTIPMIVNGTGSLRPLQFLADACDCLVIRKVRPVKRVRSIRKHELTLYSMLTKVVEEIEEALADGVITKNEYRHIHHHINELRRLSAEADMKIRKGMK